jgi:hypothetical protein
VCQTAASPPSLADTYAHLSRANFPQEDTYAHLSRANRNTYVPAGLAKEGHAQVHAIPSPQVQSGSLFNLNAQITAVLPSKRSSRRHWFYGILSFLLLLVLGIVLVRKLPLLLYLYTCVAACVSHSFLLGRRAQTQD